MQRTFNWLLIFFSFFFVSETPLQKPRQPKPPKTMATTIQPNTNIIKLLAVISFSLLVLSFVGYKANFRKCNVKDYFEYADFHRYYGINESGNPFMYSDPPTFEVPFYQLLSPGILEANSFVVMGAFGEGKTKSRQNIQEVWRRPASNKVVVELLNEAVQNRLDNFMFNMEEKHKQEYQKGYKSLRSNNNNNNNNNNNKVSESTDDANAAADSDTPDGRGGEVLAKHWVSTDYVDLVLTQLVRTILFLRRSGRFNTAQLDSEKRKALIQVLCVYSADPFLEGQHNEAPSLVIEVANEDIPWLDKKTRFTWQVEMSESVPLYRASLDAVRGVRVLKADDSRAKFMRLIFEHRKWSFPSLDQFDLLEKACDIVFEATHGKQVVLVLDALDENKHFFPGANTMFSKNIQAFVNSTVDPRVQSLAFSSKLRLGYFYPTVNGIAEAMTKLRKDKVLLVSLDWTPEHLVNYADQMLNFIRNNGNGALGRCNLLPRFTTLVSDYFLTANFVKTDDGNILCTVCNPRSLNRFMQILFSRLNSVAANSRTPFIASEADIDDSFLQLNKALASEPSYRHPPKFNAFKKLGGVVATPVQTGKAGRQDL